MSTSGQTGGRHRNRLADETSPYLLQHAHNPVDWWPWCAEAFEEARRRDVPVLLSVGYSTCYWCHVMERESFEDEGIAEQMNRGFVCVKVDREERPDVDDVYMGAVQAMTGRGGWPMTVFLEPGRGKPFWGGTYFPPEPRHNMPGFGQVLESIGAAWRDQREEVLGQADALARAVSERLGSRAEPREVGAEQVGAAVSVLLRAHDRVNGGFGGAPKFPQPSRIDLLLDFRGRAADEEAKRAADAAVRLTLDRMALGGIHDHVGGGFHRYSVDEKWVAPHFEKMLYDNALLASTYARASREYNDVFYARTARRTLEYVLREMTSGEGAFLSAQDAEVDGREGKNYLWTREEMVGALGEEDGAFAARLYGLDAGPNFRDPHHPDDAPTNVLVLADRPEALAGRIGAGPESLLTRLDLINERLYRARGAREQPATDDKVLTGWNGLMIGAMAEVGRVLGERRFVDASERAAAFVLGELRGGDGSLARVWRDGRAGSAGVLEDYAMLARGLAQLAAASGGDRWAGLAAEVVGSAEERFGDGAGGYWDVPEGAEDLFVRARSVYDGAVPCGASVMIEAMLDLYELTGEREWLDRASRALASMSGAIAADPLAAINSTRSLLRVLGLGGGALAEHTARGERGGSPTASAPSDSGEFTPVEVYASSGSVTVGKDEPGGLMLRLRIAEGFHVNAADPGPGGAGLTGLRVHVINGSGVRAYADYPEGEAYGPDGGLRVYKGEVNIPVVLDRDGEWSGTPLLAVTFQPCTESECLSAQTVELDVSIDRA